MSDETRSALREAFDAIEAGDLETARTVLEPVLAADPDNADAWWIYSHSVTDPQQALDALENVVRVDPQYPGATELLTTLRERLPRRPPKSAPPPPDDIPDLPPGEPDFELDVPPAAGSELEDADEEEEEEGRSFLIPILAGGLLIVVVLVLIVSLISQPQTPPVTPTAVALATLPPESTPLAEGQSATEDAAASTETALVEATETDAAAATSEASATESASVSPAATEDASAGTETETAPLVEATETDAAATSEAVATESASVSPAATEAVTVVVGSAEETLLAGLRRYTLAAEPITRQDTTVGNALLVSICVNDRREVPTLLRPVMRAIATGTQALPADVQAVGARMIDCATGRAFVVMAVDRASAEGHAAGTVPYVEFRQLWQPQR